MSPSVASASSPRTTARAISFKARIFGPDRPMRANRSLRARMIAVGSTGSNAAESRPQIAPALAVDSCCETTVEARPAKPPVRRRSGGLPAFAISAAKRGSAATKASMPRSRSASVWMRWSGIRDQGIRHQGSGIRHENRQILIPDPRSLIPDSMATVNTYTQNSYTHVFRFAPSPNGYLHLGHAYSALLNYDMARETGGRLLLRIEDIDTPRSRPEYEAAIYEDLEWLGISWQQPVRRQSEHFADYEAALLKLNALALLYPSFESRSEIAGLVAERDRYGRWPRDPDGVPLYPGRRSEER